MLACRGSRVRSLGGGVTRWQQQQQQSRTLATLRTLRAPVSSSSSTGTRSPSQRSITSTSRKGQATPVESSAPSANDGFMNGTNANYTSAMYHMYKEDPASVHGSWKAYFDLVDSGAEPGQAYQPPPGLIPSPADGIPNLAMDLGKSGGQENVTDHLKTQLLVRAYQVRGHRVANLDPLGLLNAGRKEQPDSMVPEELKLSHYGWTEDDLDRSITLGPGILPRFATEERTTMTIREIIDACKRIYSGSIGIQYVHIPDRKQCDWLRARLEVPEPFKYSVEEKRMILDRLIWSSSFEQFVAAKYPNEKRFGLEGAEALVPGMKALIDRSVDAGINSIVMGMPHRGRLNVLSNVVRKPNESIFCEFAGSTEPNEEGSGDVKYHLGMNYDRPTPNGKRVALSLVANPSHLESSDSIVLGKARAIQHYAEDEQAHKTAMGLLLHGDAAFAGQGVVYETLGLANLPNYSTGGTIHIIVNNQIGFTTDPRFARSTPYCTDISKSTDSPIFHVNADDVEAVTFVCQLAADWRAEYKRDCVIDLVCYRKHGHNETDQPSFTQPRMYDRIGKKEPVLKMYTDSLIDEGTFTKEDIEKHKQWVWDTLEKAYSDSKDYEPTSREWLSSSWNGFKSPKELAEEILVAHPTGVSIDTLKMIGKTISHVPEDFHVHRNLNRIVQNRGKAVEEGKGIDMSTAEALAFGSLLDEGKHIRVSGQDVERGTFSQRHAILHDQENEKQYVPLNQLSKSPRDNFVITNSSLSEFGVMGFELGYSLVNPEALVIWEAQFGDFSNGAQVIIDQYVASGERKWFQRTGLVLNLPHGYDGQGPEHSSGRLERYLQLCDDDPRVYPSEEKIRRQHQDCNMQICYPSTPANLFHMFRRQIHREYRKPLIHFFSKSLLRHPQARSELEDFSGETYFQRYLPEPGTNLCEPDKVRRHVLCSGQVYYTLLAEREKRKIDDVAISRLEQISPFPYDMITPHLDKYPNAEVMWAQEEPLNNGAFHYVAPRLVTTFAHTEHHQSQNYVPYAGRAPSSSVATGNKKQHAYEIQAFLDKAFKED